jgi:isoquinoline 1-oxidoreductase beta subunit
MKNTNMNRRTFLKVTTVAGGGLLVGCSFSSPKLLSTPNDVKEDLGMWVRIGKDDKITLILPASEMGQQSHTGQAMLVAEELEANWNYIQVVTAPVHSEYKRGSSGQKTGGSSSIMDWWEKLRHVGAGTREMLIEAAAQKWGVPVSECKAKNGEIHHLASGRRLSYGQLADAAAKLSPPDNPTLKSPDQYRFLGKSMPKLHTPARVNGTAQYGIDVRRPGMLFAAVRQSPIFNGKVKSYDESAAKAISGVEAVVPIPNGVAVVADTTWHAQKGIEAMDVRFVGGDTLGLNSSIVNEKLMAALDDMGKVDVQAEKVLEVEYEVPYLHHATMEPMNCTADVSADSCEVWVPTQIQDVCMDAAKEVTGFSEDQIQIHTTMLGGSFGRKGTKEYVEQALIISKFIQKPVQVIWSREEDTQHGTYRPASRSRFQVGLDKDGIPVQWENKIAQQSSYMFNEVPPLRWFNFDPMTYPASVHDGIIFNFPKKHFYNLEGVKMSHTPIDFGVPVGAWRSPPNSINVFYTESVMDELAHLVEIDPLEYRLKFLAQSPKHKAVLEQVAKQAGWGTPLPEGHGRGIAINDWFPFDEDVTVVAQVAEVSINNRGKLKVERVDCVIDCGIAVNPDSVKAQMEGSIIMGMSATMFEQITIEKGRVAQSNFDDYRIAKLRDAPEINVTIVESKNNPTGAGEPGTSPVVAAITNAIFAATGKRIRKLPIGRQKLV